MDPVVAELLVVLLLMVVRAVLQVVLHLTVAREVLLAVRLLLEVLAVPPVMRPLAEVQWPKVMKTLLPLEIKNFDIESGLIIGA